MLRFSDNRVLGKSMYLLKLIVDNAHVSVEWEHIASAWLLHLQSVTLAELCQKMQEGVA